MYRSSKRLLRRVAAGGALCAVLGAGWAAAAAGHQSAGLPANLATGLKEFTSVGCSACHTFKAAGAKGTIGPDLDTAKLTEAQIVLQVTKGGNQVMSAAAAAKYKFKMSAFKGRLTTAQIADVAAFVYTERGKAPVPGSLTTTTTATTTKAATTTTTAAAPPPPATTTTAAAPPPPTTTTAATTTTTAGGTDTIDGCPSGKTIPTSGNTDGDDDDNGAQSDGDGCI
jgi:mono/diheme cytochrome c family protein